MELIWGEFDWNKYGARAGDIVRKQSTALARRTVKSATIRKLPPRPENKSVCIISQYYEANLKERTEELKLCLNKNLLVGDRMVIFADGVTREGIENSGVNIKANTEVITQSRLKYRDAFEWVRDNGSDDEVYLLTNSDCYFDSVSNLLGLDYSNPTFLTMTRWEEKDGQLDIGTNLLTERWTDEQWKNPPTHSDCYLDPWSSDSWAFKKNTMLAIDTERYDRILGTSLCEIITTHRMVDEGVKVYNIGFCGHVKPIHVHKAASRKKEDWKEATELINHIHGMYPDEIEFPRTDENSIDNCWRIRTPLNFLDADQKTHDYSDFVVRDLHDIIPKIPPLKYWTNFRPSHQGMLDRQLKWDYPAGLLSEMPKTMDESSYGKLMDKGDVLCPPKADALAELKSLDSMNNLFVMGDDEHLSVHIDALEQIRHKFKNIYYEAKDIECDWVDIFPMGFSLGYLYRCGGDEVISPIVNGPLKKTKLIGKAFGSKWPELNKTIPDRVELAKVGWIDNFHCDPLEYWKKLSQYKFFCCPLGNGIQTPKLAEAIMCKTIPVVTNHVSNFELRDRWGLPLLIVEKWDNLNPMMLEDHLSDANIDWDIQREKLYDMP